MKIYMDNCCLNRPFDNQSNIRIHLEAEAIKGIISLCEQGELILISSKIQELNIKVKNPLRWLEAFLQ